MMNFLKRIENIRSIIVKENLDGILITDYYNVLYLSGFQTISPHEIESKLLITQKNIYLITDSRYIEEAKEHAKNAPGITLKIQTVKKSFLEIIKDLIKKENLDNIAFESHHLSFDIYDYLKKNIAQSRLHPLSNPVSKLRKIKNKDEINLMKTAAEKTDLCMSYAKSLIKIGAHERDIYNEILNWIRKNNLEKSFDPIVAVSSNSALPHYNNKNGNKIIKDVSVILVDLGVSYKNYTSDISRTFLMKNVGDKVKKTYQDLLNIQKNTLSKIKIGGRRIFNSQNNGKRFINTLKYYKSSKALMKYSEYKKIQLENRLINDNLIFDPKFYYVEVIAYCLMPNHFHLLLKQNLENGIKIFISKSLNSFTKQINIKFKLNGPIFLPRFKSKLIKTDEEFKHVSRYIHLNPTTSNLIDKNKLAKYPLSSFKYYASPEENDILDRAYLMRLFNNDFNKYKKFVLQNADYQRSLKR